MATATKATRTKSNGRAAKGPAAAEKFPTPAEYAAREADDVRPPEHPMIGHTHYLPVGRLVPSPFNPRTDFDEAGLKQLGESLKKNGQIQAIVVRPGDPEVGNFEIIAGERRWRAAKLAKIDRLRCDVVDVTDEEAIELAGEENYRRQQLNPIEEANWFRSMIEGCHLTQAALAKRLNLSQPQIANRLALLTLPPVVRDLVAAGKLSATNARALAPWCDLVEVREGMLEEIGDRNAADEPYTALDFADDLGHRLARHSRPVRADVRHGPLFKITAAMREQLDVRLVPRGVAWNEAERAFNVEYWEALQKEAKKAQRAKGKAKERAAEKRAQRTDETPAAEPAVETDRLHELWEMWWRTAIADRMNRPLDPTPDDLRLLMVIAHEGGDLMDSWIDALRITLFGQQRQPGCIQSNYVGRDKLWGKLIGLKGKDVPDLLRRALDEMLRNSPPDHWLMESLGPLAKWLKIEPQKTWRPTADWFEGLTAAQAREIGRGVFGKELPPEADADEAQLKAWMIESWPAGKIPKAFADPSGRR